MKLASRLVVALGTCAFGVSLTLLTITNKASTVPSALELPNWRISQVDTDNGISTRGNTAIVLDASDQAHMSYVSNEELRYAILSSTTWITQTVDLGARVRGHSLTVDAANKPHIAYVALQPAATSGYLRYATISGTMWITQTVEDNPSIAGTYGCQVSIAVDGNQRPHISYGAIPILKHAVLTTTGWLIDIVDAAVYGYMCSALDVEESGVPHIAYYDMGPSYGGMLKYAILEGTLWEVQTVDEYPSLDGADFGLPSTLRLDNSQSPHVLYYDAPNKRLKYAVLSGTVWISETVPSLSPIDYNSRGFMALDSHDNPHVSFAGQYGQDLMYATLTHTQWMSQTVDNSLGAGWANSIGLDNEDTVYISYLNTYLNRVKVAQSWYPREWIFLPLVVRQ